MRLILQPYRHFTYVTAQSPTLPSLYLRHSSFSNTSAASPTSQFILQLFFHFSYVTSSSLNSPGEPPRPQGPRISSGHHYHYQSSFITGANDLRCWCALRSQIYIHTYKINWLYAALVHSSNDRSVHKITLCGNNLGTAKTFIEARRNWNLSLKFRK